MNMKQKGEFIRMRFTKRFIAAMLSLTIIFVTVESAYSEKAKAAITDEQTIFSFLKSTLGFNTAAACGVLGNLCVESSSFSSVEYNPYENAWGICQWRNDRLENLQSRYPSSWKTLEAQLGFLKWELEGGDYNGKKTLNYLKSVEDSADGASDAALYFAQYFERCDADTYTLRKNRAKNTYWPKYGTVTDTHIIDNRFPQDFITYLADPLSKHYCFNADHSYNDHYVDDVDPCTVHEVYTDGCCKFTYITSSGKEITTYGDILWFDIDFSEFKPGKYKTTANSGLRLRAEARLDAEQLALIPYGTEVNISEFSGTWGKTSYNGYTGWISMEYAEWVGSNALPTESYDNTHINTGNPAFDIVEVAKTQIGYTEGNNNDNKYGAYFGTNYASWCAFFVVWCARQADIGSDVVSFTGWATADDLGVTYKGRNAARTEGINYTPKPGDFIIYDWSSDGYNTKNPASFYGDHVGIVEYVENGYVHTIEGNYDNSVKRRTIALNDNEIKGFGVPAYNLETEELFENTHINTGNKAFDIVEVAKTQVGYTEGSNNDNKYSSSFGVNNASWCAYFVVWCARQAGISEDEVALTGWATADDLGVTYKGRNADRSEGINYTPKTGDFIIYDWEDNGFCVKSPASFYGDHVGIVEYVENGYVHTIEGNYDDGVRRRTIALDDCNIKGYGVPAYNIEAHTHSYSSVITTAPTCSEPGVKTFTCTCGDSYKETLPLTAHQFSDIVLPEYIKSEATCTSPEVYYKSCAYCGTVSMDTFTSGSANGHEIRDIVIPATATEQGYTVHACLNCDYSYTDSYTDPIEDPDEDDIVPGDINGDGEIDAADAGLISRYDAGFITLTAEQLLAGDVNKDGEVDAADAGLISRYDAGFISAF